MENGKYKYEIHCHTDETSVCGKVPAAELVKIYKEKGYDGVVITDHYSQMTFGEKNVFRAGKLYDRFLMGYRNAKAAADDDFTVLLGMEIRGWFSAIDFLVYGVTEEFVENAGNLLFRYCRRFYKIAHRNGMIVVGAHPFRMSPLKPNHRFIDGAEIYNGKESKENNHKALEWAKKHKIAIKTSGSDFHRTTHTNFSGIRTNEPIKTNADLLRILKSGEYEVITNEANF